MLFNSYEFLYFFLPACLLAVYACQRLQWRETSIGLLFIASLVYYGWWNYHYLALIGLSMAGNYGWGLLMQRHRARWLLGIGIAINVALLGHYKYTDFLIDAGNLVFGTELPLQHIVLPLAISFFTFQQIAYLVDVYRGEVIEHNFWHYCFFVTFFPQLIAGPIVHHKEMMPQITSGRGLSLVPANISLGLTFLIIGLAKKVLIADHFALYASPAFAAVDQGSGFNIVESWAAALCYSFQLYFDFSGYADMALGLAKLFGIDLPLNFNSPYKSRSIAEFWRRWHLTLSRFLRDYIFIPLGGSRVSTSRHYLNLSITMIVAGIWHGAGWHYLVWGCLHAAYICLNHAWTSWRHRAGFGHWDNSRVYGGLCFVITLIALGFNWPLFRAETLPGAILMIQSMVGMTPEQLAHNAGWLTPSAWRWLIGGALVCWLAPNSQELLGRRESPDGSVSYDFQPRAWHVLVLVILLVNVLFRLTDVSEFLYYQF